MSPLWVYIPQGEVWILYTRSRVTNQAPTERLHVGFVSQVSRCWPSRLYIFSSRSKDAVLQKESIDPWLLKSNISDPDHRQGTCIKRSNERKNRACFMHELRQWALLATIVGCMLLRYAVRICASEGGHQFQHLHSLFGSVLYYFWWCQHYIYVLDVYNISPQLGLPD